MPGTPVASPRPEFAAGTPWASAGRRHGREPANGKERRMSETPTMTREAVFEALGARGATKALVSFSGGNDEGGPDTVTLLGPEGKELDEVRDYVPNQVFDDDGAMLFDEFEDLHGKFWRPRTRPYTDEEAREMALCDALAAPIDDEYGGFAGDFSVSGTLVWDVAAGTVTMRGEETEYVPFEKEL